MPAKRFYSSKGRRKRDRCDYTNKKRKAIERVDVSVFGRQITSATRRRSAFFLFFFVFVLYAIYLMYVCVCVFVLVLYAIDFLFCWRRLVPADGSHWLYWRNGVVGRVRRYESFSLSLFLPSLWWWFWFWEAPTTRPCLWPRGKGSCPRDDVVVTLALRLWRHVPQMTQ